MSQRKFLNLGCGRITLPCPKPSHHGLVDDAIYAYPLVLNVDRNGGEGVDECVDVFTYPWRWEDNSFDGALLSHLAEHIPHEIKVHRQPEMSAVDAEFHEQMIDMLTPTIKRSDPLRMPVYRGGGLSPRAEQLLKCQDGWYAFFAELYRVLTNGAIVHILSPYGWSHGAAVDPTHTRLLFEHSFMHSMQPNPDAPFAYETGGINFAFEGWGYTVTPLFSHLVGTEQDDDQTKIRKHVELTRAMQTQLNVLNDMYVKLRAVK